MQGIEKINFLLDKLEASSFLRKNNLKYLKQLFKKLELKHSDFSTIFDYAGMNLAGIGLKEDEFGEIREGKYVQIIAIAYEVDEDNKRIIKNASLGYYGKAEKLEEKAKNEIIEFVLRWRYEKTFQHSDYYQQLLQKLH